jgi:membrane protein YqaA with SNARE-associated domain
MRILAQLIIPDSMGTFIQGLGKLGLIRLGVVVLGLVAIPDSVWTWVQGLGGVGLILVGLVDNTPFVSAPPGSEDVFLILLCAHHPHWWVYYAFMATVGEVLGGYLGYRLSAKGGQETFEKKVGRPRAEKIYKYFEKRGFLTVLAGSMLPPPFPFGPVVMAAGVMQYPRQKFLSALFTGRAARFFVEAFLGRVYGQQMIDFFSRHYHILLYVLISVLVAAGVGALVYFMWYRPNQRRRSGAHPAGPKGKPASEAHGVN